MQTTKKLFFLTLRNSLGPSELIIAEGLSGIEKFYNDLSEKYGYQALPEYRAVNHAGYNALNKEDFDTAILLSKRNVTKYSNKSDAYDSLADGYEAMGDLDNARIGLALD